MNWKNKPEIFLIEDFLIICLLVILFFEDKQRNLNFRLIVKNAEIWNVTWWGKFEMWNTEDLALFKLPCVLAGWIMHYGWAQKSLANMDKLLRFYFISFD